MLSRAKQRTIYGHISCPSSLRSDQCQASFLILDFAQVCGTFRDHHLQGGTNVPLSSRRSLAGLQMCVARRFHVEACAASYEEP